MADADAEPAPPLGLFRGFGVEIEYAIVDARTLAVRPLADALIEAECGRIEGEILRGEMAWSNELARHVIELKTADPVPSKFNEQVRKYYEVLGRSAQ